jgi:hypothetical protein
MSNFTVELINRGEQVLYREGNRSLMVDVDFVDGAFRLCAYHLTHWATPAAEPLTDLERRTIIERIVSNFKAGGSKLTLLHEPPPPGPPPITRRDVWEYRKRLGIETPEQNEF